MSTPRPESRLNELESRMSLHGARIRELSDDTAESLRDLKQDIKQLSESIGASNKEIGDFFVLLDKDAEMTKEDLSTLEQTQDEHFDKLEQTQDRHSKKLDEHSDMRRLILQLLQQKPSK